MQEMVLAQAAHADSPEAQPGSAPLCSIQVFTPESDTSATLLCMLASPGAQHGASKNHSLPGRDLRVECRNLQTSPGDIRSGYSERHDGKSIPVRRGQCIPCNR